MLKRQTGYDKKLKTPIYEQLTYQFFSEHVDHEYWFKYKNQTIDIANFEKDGKIIYHISIDGQHQEFNSPEELLVNGRIDGKTIKDIWEDLEN